MDRFIPNRSAVDLDLAHFSPRQGERREQGPSMLHARKQGARLPSRKWGRVAAEGLLGEQLRGSGFLPSRPRPPPPPRATTTSPGSRKHGNSEATSEEAAPRAAITTASAGEDLGCPRASRRLLPEPDRLERQQRAGRRPEQLCVYLWNASTGDIQQLVSQADDGVAFSIASVQWSADGALSRRHGRWARADRDAGLPRAVRNLRGALGPRQAPAGTLPPSPRRRPGTT